MATVASLLVRLAADFGDTSGKMHEVAGAAKHMGEASEEAGKHVDNLGHHAHEAEDQFEGLQEKLAEFGKEMLKFGVEALGVASAFEVLKESMEVAAEIESVTVALTEFTGSAEDAKDMIEQLEAVAGSEALKFPEVLPAAQHFMALGFSAEQTVSSIKAAGNAAWALGTSVESVTQRMGMMAMGGQVSARFLRSLGIDLKDLASIMGITGSSTADLEDKVRRAFKFESEEERLLALTGAMGKFGNLGAKEAETLSGKWIEFKNTSHEAFATLGRDLTPLASVFLDLGTFVNGAASALLNMLDPLNEIKDALDNIGHTKGMLALGDLMSKENKKRLEENSKEKEVSAFSTRPTGSWEGRVNQENTDKTIAAAEASNDINLAIMPKFKPQDVKPITLEGAAAYAKQQSDAKKALAESDAAQEYTLQKTRINAQSQAAKAQVELWRAAYAMMNATGQMSHAVTLAQDKQFNEDELRITLDAIARKKALQTSTKGLKEEEKDTTLDSQAAAAREQYQSKNAALAAKEEERAKKAVDTAVKFGESMRAAEDGRIVSHAEYVNKLREQNDKMLHELESFAFDNADFNKRIADDNIKSADDAARVAEKQTISGARDVASAGTQSNRSSQLALERSYGMEITHTLAQQIEYQRTLGELHARELDIKAEELKVTAAMSKADADRANASLDVSSTDAEVANAATLTLKAHADDLRVTEALAAASNTRYENETKIAEELRKQSVSGQLAAQFASVGQSLPGALGGAVASGVMNQGRGGMDVGKQVVDALRNAGKELFGDVLSAVIKQLIVTLGVNTLAQTVLHVLFPSTIIPNTVANTVNTGATVVNTAAVAANTIALTVGNAAQIGFLASIDAGVWALFAKPSVLGTTFDTGGPVPYTMPALVHGGEHVLNADQVAGTAPLPDIPSLRGLKASGRTAGALLSSLSSSNGPRGDNHFTINESFSARDTAREVADVMKQLDPSHATSSVPYST